jgi:hypothetical protein
MKSPKPRSIAMYDLTDYSQFLEMERDAELDKAIAEDRAREADEIVLEDVVLEYEVKNMMEMM